MEQQRKADRPAEELGEIGGHRRQLADDPHRHDDGARKLGAAQLGEVALGDQTELRRQGLEQHGQEIGDDQHPEQGVAVSRAGLDVRREIAGVHVGDRGDHRRSGKQQEGEWMPRRAPVENVRDGRRRASRHAERCCVSRHRSRIALAIFQREGLLRGDERGLMSRLRSSPTR